MINGQDALLLVASILVQHENSMNQAYLTQEVASSLNTTIPRAGFLIHLMYDKGYLKVDLHIHHPSSRTTQIYSLTPLACARVREINAHRKYIEQEMKLVDGGVFA